VPFVQPDHVPLDEAPHDTIAADLTLQQNKNLPYNPLNMSAPPLPIVEPLDIHSGIEFASLEVASIVSISERDMDSSYFADGATPPPSKLASSISYGDLAMGVPDFLTRPEIDSVIYLNNSHDIAKISTEPTEADIRKLGYYPAQWEIIETDDSGYYIKIEDNIYYINLKSDIESDENKMAAFDQIRDGSAPIDNNFISQHLEHLKKTGKGMFNNFKKVTRY
ncbi:MAG: hypothetical protein JRJ44_09375, partial [Deltaproteobacteria bacterium]|nr:hypothetical protein [Deltaproteobacteria bacterium]